MTFADDWIREIALKWGRLHLIMDMLYTVIGIARNALNGKSTLSMLSQSQLYFQTCQHFIFYNELCEINSGVYSND